MATKKQKKTNKKPKNKRRKKNEKTQKIPQKWAFQLSVNFFLLFGGCPKFPFFDNLAQKARTQKNTIKKGVQQVFLETDVRHETAISGQKKPKPEIPVINCFLPFLLFQHQKHKKCQNLYFYSVLANLKKRIFKC